MFKYNNSTDSKILFRFCILKFRQGFRLPNLMSDIDEPEFKTNRQCVDLYMNKRKRHLAADDEELDSDDKINFDEPYTFSDDEIEKQAEMSQIITDDSETVNDDCQTNCEFSLEINIEKQIQKYC